jgi:hypothetical protein
MVIRARHYALPLLIVGQSLAVYIWRHDPFWWQGMTHAIVDSPSVDRHPGTPDYGWMSNTTPQLQLGLPPSKVEP